MSTELAIGEQPHLAQRYREIRDFSLSLAGPLSPEDCAMQSMDDASPTKWHLAHTTWFFETFVLGKQAAYEVFDKSFSYLLNSYYNSVGGQFPRSQRGVISRPSYSQVIEYRSYVDEHMRRLFDSDAALSETLGRVLEIGLNHEQQHQELILTDIKHALSSNPLFPTYLPLNDEGTSEPHALSFVNFDDGIHEIGHSDVGFTFDNELPRHRVFLEPYALSNRGVSNGEYLQFVKDGGYERPEHWLSLGWNEVQEQAWKCPLYWQEIDGEFHEFTLGGLQPLDLSLPLTHVSYFEADAFARWYGARLPTEAEWEAASANSAESTSVDGRFANDYLEEMSAPHPTFATQSKCGLGLFGNVWEWTSSSYGPYPGYRIPAGAIGEYNGKFMCNQYVLRGGSCATPRDHIRPTYRNFFPPEARWQFSGIRLAK